MRPEEATIEVARALKELSRTAKEMCANVETIARAAKAMQQAHASDYQGEEPHYCHCCGQRL